MDQEKEGTEGQETEKEVETTEETVVEEKVEEGDEKADRPDINYKAELERKNREIERLRTLATVSPKETPRYDANDVTTWSENDLRALVASNDPQWLRFKAQAQDVLDDRRLERKLAEREAVSKRVKSEMDLRAKYPEALDPTSSFASRMEEVIHELDLSKSPAGRLAAAKIVAAELGKSSSKAVEKGRKSESKRLADVKGHLNEGDRPNVKGNEAEKAQQDLAKRVASGDKDAMHQAIMARIPNPFKK